MKMKSQHYEQLKEWLIAKMEQKPDLFRKGYAPLGFPLSKYIWDMIHGLNQNRWIIEVLYPYLNDQQIEDAAVLILNEWGLYESS